MGTTNDNFGERMRKWRVTQKMTQAEAAQQLDIDRSYLSQVERGRSPGRALQTRFVIAEQGRPALWECQPHLRPAKPSGALLGAGRRGDRLR